MSILDLYSHIKEKRERFIDEIFEGGIYKRACPQLTLVDLGAYQGEFCFYCLPFLDMAYAVEPDPRPYSELLKTISKFKLEDKIIPFDIAISGKNGPRHFHASGYGGSALNGPMANSSEMKVETLTLNSFLEREKIESVDILKIDVESAEAEIFGAEDFPEAAKKVKYIIGEPHRGEEVRGVLEANGYIVNFWPDNIFTAKK